MVKSTVFVDLLGNDETANLHTYSFQACIKEFIYSGLKVTLSVQGQN